MKKSAKAKAPKAAKQEKPDLFEAVSKIKEQLAIIEMKIDVLTGRLTIKPPEPKYQPEPPLARGEFQRPKEQKQIPGQGRPMYKAICADCKDECEVPFQPKEGRAVYCKECYAERRSGKPKANGNVAPQQAKPAPEPVAVPAAPDRKKWGNVKSKATAKKAAKKGKKR